MQIDAEKLLLYLKERQKFHEAKHAAVEKELLSDAFDREMSSDERQAKMGEFHQSAGAILALNDIIVKIVIDEFEP